MNALRSTLMKVALAGGAGLVVMELVRRISAPLIKEKPPSPLDVFPTERSISPLGPQHSAEESATDAIGRIAYEKVTGEEPTPATKRELSWTVHIGYGLFVTALFMAIRHHPRVVRDGVLFGTALWLFGDELAAPLLGLADKPTAYSASRHAQALAQHIGFGVTTAAATRYLEASS